MQELTMNTYLVFFFSQNATRERNREHAKRSRVRKKFLLESLQKSVTALQEENEKLRGAIRANLGADEAKELLAQTESSSLIASNPGDATKVTLAPRALSRFDELYFSRWWCCCLVVVGGWWWWWWN